MPALHKTSLTFSRIVFVFAFLCFVTATANAYTVVMHAADESRFRRLHLNCVNLDLRSFTGFFKSPQSRAIDVAATEKANNEAPGVFCATTHGSSLSAPSASPSCQSHNYESRFGIFKSPRRESGWLMSGDERNWAALVGGGWRHADKRKLKLLDAKRLAADERCGKGVGNLLARASFGAEKRDRCGGC